MNSKNKNDVKKHDNNQNPKPTKNLSEDEQLFLYADIISNLIIKAIIKADEEREHHSS